jgi:hypothetical protein
MLILKTLKRLNACCLPWCRFFLRPEDIRAAARARSLKAFRAALPEALQIYAGWCVGRLVKPSRLGIGPEADLKGANLNWANLPGIDLHGADLTGARLAYSNLTGANLSGANLTKADLWSAQLVATNLEKANLTGSSISPEVVTGDLICRFDRS